MTCTSTHRIWKGESWEKKEKKEDNRRMDEGRNNIFVHKHCEFENGLGEFLIFDFFVVSCDSSFIRQFSTKQRQANSR